MKVMNFLSTKILLAIYNKLSDISVNIDDILMKRCMKLIQPLIEQNEFEKVKMEINKFFGPQSEVSVAKNLCIFQLVNAFDKYKEKQNLGQCDNNQTEKHRRDTV